MKPELVTNLTFNDSVILEVSADKETVLLSIYRPGDFDPDSRAVNLEVDDIDLVIATLARYKKHLERK